MATPASKILRPEEVASSSYARWGIYGVNGVGKTSLLRTIPESIPTLVVSADEENVKVLRGLKHVRVWKIQRWDELSDLLLFLTKQKHPFKALAFDTWSRIQGLALNKVVGYEPNLEQVEKFINNIPKNAQGFETWRRIGDLAAEWMRYFERLPLHTIFLMQEADRVNTTNDEGGESKITMTGPALTPVASRAALEALELVGRLYVDLDDGDELSLDGAAGNARKISREAKEVRRLLIGKHPRYLTKGPTHLLGYVVDDPTWDVLARSLV